MEKENELLLSKNGIYPNMLKVAARYIEILYRGLPYLHVDISDLANLFLKVFLTHPEVLKTNHVRSEGTHGEGYKEILEGSIRDRNTEGQRGPVFAKIETREEYHKVEDSFSDYETGCIVYALSILSVLDDEDLKSIILDMFK